MFIHILWVPNIVSVACEWLKTDSFCSSLWEFILFLPFHTMEFKFLRWHMMKCLILRTRSNSITFSFMRFHYWEICAFIIERFGFLWKWSTLFLLLRCYIDFIHLCLLLIFQSYFKNIEWFLRNFIFNTYYIFKMEIVCMFWATNWLKSWNSMQWWSVNM